MVLADDDDDDDDDADADADADDDDDEFFPKKSTSERTKKLLKQPGKRRVMQ